MQSRMKNFNPGDRSVRDKNMVFLYFSSFLYSLTWFLFVMYRFSLALTLQS